MNFLTLKERFQIVEIYFQNQSSVCETNRALRPFYGRHKRPSEQAFRFLMDKFHTTFIHFMTLDHQQDKEIFVPKKPHSH